MTWCCIRLLLPCCAAAAIKGLAQSLFKFNLAQLNAAIIVVKQKLKEKGEDYSEWSTAAIVKKLPLNTWQSTVQRVYLPGDEQVQRLEEWLDNYVRNPAIFVDANGRTLVAGGQDGMDKFVRVFDSQLHLAQEEFLSGEGHQQDGDMFGRHLCKATASCGSASCGLTCA